MPEIVEMPDTPDTSSKIVRLRQEKKTLESSIAALKDDKGHEETVTAYKKRISEIEKRISEIEKLEKKP